MTSFLANEANERGQKNRAEVSPACRFRLYCRRNVGKLKPFTMSEVSSPPIAATAGTTTPPQSSQRRLVSLDALRGFDMFWIVGGEELVHGLYKGWPNGLTGLLDREMDHQPWAGVHCYDLIFPLFVFIVGASIVFSLSRMVERVGKVAALKRVVIRSAILYCFGLLVYGGISQGLEHVRWLGVLQRIALCYLFTSVFFCTFKLRGLIVICAALLLGYWAETSLMPIRDFNLERSHLSALKLEPDSPRTRARFLAITSTVRGKFEDGLNLTQQIDFQYLPGYKWDGAYDPEGILSTLPAIGTCLLGVFAGFLLKNPKVPDQRKVVYFLVAGVLGVALGFLWGLQFPVIKKIWTSSVRAGCGGLLVFIVRRVLPDGRDLAMAQMVHPVCLGGNEPDHDLPGLSPGRVYAPGQTGRRRSGVPGARVLG